MSAPTRSEFNFDRILTNSGVTVESIKESKSVRPDRSLQLHGHKVIAEWKEKIRGDFESEMTQSRTNFGFWGSEEGSRQVRSDGRVDWSGWAGHIAKAIEQLRASSEQGLPTLVGLQSHSMKAELDPASLYLLMYGHGTRIDGNQLVVSQTACNGRMPVLAGFTDWPCISAVAYLFERKIHVFANSFARVPIDPAWFQYDCFGPVYTPGGNQFSPTWQEWYSGDMPVTAITR